MRAFPWLSHLFFIKSILYINYICRYTLCRYYIHARRIVLHYYCYNIIIIMYTDTNLWIILYKIYILYILIYVYTFYVFVTTFLGIYKIIYILLYVLYYNEIRIDMKYCVFGLSDIILSLSERNSVQKHVRTYWVYLSDRL